MLLLKYMAPGTWYQGPGTRYRYPRYWYQVCRTFYCIGTRYLVPVPNLCNRLATSFELTSEPCIRSISGVPPWYRERLGCINGSCGIRTIVIKQSPPPTKQNQPAEPKTTRTDLIGIHSFLNRLSIHTVEYGTAVLFSYW